MRRKSKLRTLFKKAAIIGVGLIGGSLALAIKKEGLAGSVVGIDVREGDLVEAQGRGAIDHYALNPRVGVEGCDLVVLATPVGLFESIMREAAPNLRAECTVTDVGSTKSALVGKIESLVPESASFVGGHPITGRERTGFAAASAELFRGSKCILTPTGKTDPKALERVKQLWQGIGSQVVLMDPVEHDRILATISHLPHLVAYALVNTAMDVLNQDGALLSLSAGGFRDFSRIAASSPEIWRDICLQNEKFILQNIEAYQTTLNRLKDLIAGRDGERLLREFQRSKDLRDKLV